MNSVSFIFLLSAISSAFWSFDCAPQRRQNSSRAETQMHSMYDGHSGISAGSSSDISISGRSSSLGSQGRRRNRWGASAYAGGIGGSHLNSGMATSTVGNTGTRSGHGMSAGSSKPMGSNTALTNGMRTSFGSNSEMNNRMGTSMGTSLGFSNKMGSSMATGGKFNSGLSSSADSGNKLNSGMGVASQSNANHHTNSEMPQSNLGTSSGFGLNGNAESGMLMGSSREWKPSDMRSGFAAGINSDVKWSQGGSGGTGIAAGSTLRY